MPCLAASHITRLRAFKPSACPAVRGSDRFFAHRPFPSMMMPRWAGTTGLSSILNLHDFLLLLIREGVDLGDVGISHLLDLAFCILELIFADVSVFLHFLQLVHSLAPDVTHS